VAENEAMKNLQLRRLRKLPTPEGLEVLADDAAADPSEPEGLEGFLRTAAIEIELSRKKIRKLERKKKKS
jgi:TusA-related sulfurtransferase